MKIVIAIVAAVALAAVVGAIWVGARTFERTVVADPYESGIHHDADRRKAQALGWNVAVDEGSLRAGPEAALAVRLTGKDGAPIDDAEVLFRVSRAGTSRFDRSAPATRAGERAVRRRPLHDRARVLGPRRRDPAGRRVAHPGQVDPRGRRGRRGGPLRRGAAPLRRRRRATSGWSSTSRRTRPFP